MSDKKNRTYSKKVFVIQSMQMVNTVLFWIFFTGSPRILPISYSLFELILFVLSIIDLLGIITGTIGHLMLKKAAAVGENNKYTDYASIMSTINIVIGCIPILVFILMHSNPTA